MIAFVRFFARKQRAHAPFGLTHPSALQLHLLNKRNFRRKRKAWETLVYKGLKRVLKNGQDRKRAHLCVFAKKCAFRRFLHSVKTVSCGESYRKLAD